MVMLMYNMAKKRLFGQKMTKYGKFLDIQKLTHTHTQTHTQARRHTNTHKHTGKHTHTQTHTHTHTHTHTQTNMILDTLGNKHKSSMDTKLKWSKSKISFFGRKMTMSGGVS